MNLLFCGTAAAEGWPALFCTCTACQRARALGGKDIRSRAAYMLGDTVRVDFGPDSNLHQQKYGLAYERLQHLLITHSHDDHWFPTDLAYRKAGFSVVADTPLQIWGNEAVERKFISVNGNDWNAYNVTFHRIERFQSIMLENALTVTPVPAAHDRAEECMNFRIECDGRTLLLGHDTGWYDLPSWEFLSDQPLNMLVLDCTYGPSEGNRGHLGCPWVVKFRDELAKRGGLAVDARVIATHFSHNGGWLHEELEAYFSPQGIEVAYDGMQVSI